MEVNWVTWRVWARPPAEGFVVAAVSHLEDAYLKVSDIGAFFVLVRGAGRGSWERSSHWA